MQVHTDPLSVKDWRSVIIGRSQLLIPSLVYFWTDKKRFSALVGQEARRPIKSLVWKRLSTITDLWHGSTFVGSGRVDQSLVSVLSVYNVYLEKDRFYFEKLMIVGVLNCKRIFFRKQHDQRNEDDRLGEQLRET